MPWVPKASVEETAAAPGGDVATTEPKGEGGKKGGKAGGKKGKSKSKKEEPFEVPPPPPVTAEGKKGGSKGKGKGKSGKPKGAEAEKGGDDFYPPYRDEDEDSSAGKRGGGHKGGKKGKGKGGGGKGRGSGGDDDGVERAEKPERNNRSDDSRRQAALQKGRHCDVRKHSSMGCAIVTFEDPTVRDMVLKESLTATIGGIQVKLKPHFDKEAKENVPTDLFVGWGRQVEKATPLSESKLVEYFDGKHEEFLNMAPAALHSLQMQQAMQRQLAAGTAGRPGAVPQVSSATSTASRVPSSMANAALLQQQQQALQVQQQQQWLAQMQQAQAYYYHMLYHQQAMHAYAAAQQQQAAALEPQPDRDRTQQRANNRNIKPAYRRPTDEELQATIGALSEKAQSSS